MVARPVADVLRAPALGGALWRAHEVVRAAGHCVPSQWPALDAQLPGGGWPQQALTELLLPALTRTFHQGRGSCADAGASGVAREGRSPMPYKDSLGCIGEHLSASQPPLRRASPRSPDDPNWLSDSCHEAVSSEREKIHKRGRPGEISGLGLGELRLILPALVAQARAGKTVVWIAPPALPYAPALVQAGLPLAHMVLVQPQREADTAWALEQALRSGAVGAVLAWLPEAQRLARSEQLRRLQVVAAGSNSLCFLFRPAAARGQASAAPLRIALQAVAPQRLALTIFKRRGPPQAAPLLLDVSSEAAANDAS